MVTLVTVDDVKTLLDFSGKSDFQPSEAMVILQTEGVAALCNILKKKKVAYLADEVGLGKTMQALGVIALFKKNNPKAKILVISPREIVQQGWANEFLNFKKNIYQGNPDYLPDSFDRKDNLYEWLQSDLSENSIPLLRHTSFTRPAFFTGDHLQEAWHQLRTHWHEIPGMHLPGKVPTVINDDYSHYLNMAVAKAIDEKLSKDQIVFDLVVVDEAQCLRNPDNQTNKIFHTLLKDRVKNWLFLSATPAHSGIDNLKTVLNHYTSREILPDGLFEASDNYSKLLKKLSEYMIRRPRTYHVDEKIYHKSDYRQDDKKSLAITCDTALSTLTIALVQKKLVEVLSSVENSNQGGRFKAGYMASFESLDDSVPQGKVEKSRDRTTDGDASVADFYSEKDHRNQADDAPDTGFIAKLSADFKKYFGNRHLPHPKIDKVAEEISVNAFGSEKTKNHGGKKTLVFCRRVSSVYSLRDRIMSSYLSGIEQRCKRVWSVELNWDIGFDGPFNAGDDDTDMGTGDDHDLGNGIIEEIKNEKVKNKFRLAGQVKGWLHRFRSTFEDGGKHAMFFEENWFLRLCLEGNVTFEQAYAKIPPEIWQDALVFATKNQKRYKRRMHRYIVWHCLNQSANEVFGLDTDTASFWKKVLSNIFSEEITSSLNNQSPHLEKGFSDKSILDFSSFWSSIDNFAERFGIALPGSIGVRDENLIYERQVLKTVLYRYLLLSDAVIDLYFADKTGNSRLMDEKFVNWFKSDDIDAIRLREIFTEWIENRALIFRSAFAEHAELNVLAGKESFEYLYAMEPVMAITGGGGDRRRLVRQFNMPGLPYVVVGTDTLREGVNLHLFCDRVMHFGVAWTSGDLEQRVGRVDRYFSFIERRLKKKPAHPEGKKIELSILYPYLIETLEKRQIDVVMARKAANEKLMDSPLAGMNKEDQQISIDEYMPQNTNESMSANTDWFSVAKHLHVIR
ncbi:SNF2-related protein [Undibacterium sp. Ji49W]|uniref:SNF2-related protein n=1 Tax=Undibacterium sp. Ji49W TaxID=3413040 RepID=UPI003BF2C4A2